MDIVTRFKEQYPCHTLFHDGQTSDAILKQLESLGPRPKKEDIDRITGNTAWTTIGCSYCRDQNQDALVVLNYYDEFTSYICKKCLQEALNGL